MIDPSPRIPTGGRVVRADGAAAPGGRFTDGVSIGAATSLALLAVLLRWRGADLPAAVYRINDFRLQGFRLWDSQWYGGHHALGWSVLLPPVGAVLGTALTGVLSAVVATWLFAGIARRHLGGAALAASVVFGCGTVVNQAVGRLPFSLGLAIGLGAVVVGLERRSSVWGFLLAVLTTLASPVAGAFVALAGGAWALSPVTRPSEWRRVQREGLAVAAGAALPIAVISIAFPDGGRFPFRGAALVALLLSSLGLWLAVPPRLRVVRIGIVLYALSAVVLFVVPNPMGANAIRLATVVGAPLAVAALWGGRRWIAVIVAIGLLWWHWSPAVDAMFRAGDDPSASADYYAPMVSALIGAGAGERVEIPFTRHHWETVYVADRAPLARGWERQLDLRYNAVLYSPTLDADQYHAWLLDNAVRFVALPDAPIDGSSAAEAAILAHPPTWLRPVWHDAHWQLWEVVDAQPIVDGPARLVRSDDDGFAVEVPAPGSYVVRIHHSPRFSVADGAACVAATEDGWTRVDARRAGLVEVSVALRSAPDSSCES